MSDYRGQIEACDRLDRKMSERGIVQREKTYYVTPDGTEYDCVSDAIRQAPILNPAEYEPCFDGCSVIGYRKVEL